MNDGLASQKVVNLLRNEHSQCTRNMIFSFTLKLAHEHLTQNQAFHLSTYTKFAKEKKKPYTGRNEHQQCAQINTHTPIESTAQQYNTHQPKQRKTKPDINSMEGEKTKSHRNGHSRNEPQTTTLLIPHTIVINTPITKLVDGTYHTTIPTKRLISFPHIHIQHTPQIRARRHCRGGHINGSHQRYTAHCGLATAVTVLYNHGRAGPSILELGPVTLQSVTPIHEQVVRLPLGRRHRGGRRGRLNGSRRFRRHQQIRARRRCRGGHINGSHQRCIAHRSLVTAVTVLHNHGRLGRPKHT